MARELREKTAGRDSLCDLLDWLPSCGRAGRVSILGGCPFLLRLGMRAIVCFVEDVANSNPLRFAIRAGTMKAEGEENDSRSLVAPLLGMTSLRQHANEKRG